MFWGHLLLIYINDFKCACRESLFLHADEFSIQSHRHESRLCVIEKLREVRTQLIDNKLSLDTDKWSIGPHPH